MFIQGTFPKERLLILNVFIINGMQGDNHPAPLVVQVCSGTDICFLQIAAGIPSKSISDKRMPYSSTYIRSGRGTRGEILSGGG